MPFTATLLLRHNYKQPNCLIPPCASFRKDRRTGATMHVPLAPRATDTSKPQGLESGSTNPAIIVRLLVLNPETGDKADSKQGVAVAVAFVFIFIATYVYVAKNRPPNYSTTPKKSKWQSWNLRSSKMGRLLHLKSATPSANSHDMEETAYTPSTHSTNTTNRSTDEGSHDDGVNRNTSIRSIMTLPPYRPTPHPHERLIAREGERGGVDTVIEFPETADEEEMRREQEMDSLYQIRQARRNEMAERNQRREERQEAREAQDWARLEQLRLQSQMRARARAESTGSAASSTSSLPAATSTATNASSLLADHQARNSSQDRRVSSVSYADLGLARHDGSRIRADSVESDHRPLLESAASMGGDQRPTTSSQRSSLFHTHTFHHNRAPSAESAMTTDSELAGMRELTPETSSGNRTGSDVAVRTPSASGSGQDTSSEISPPLGEPPRYEVSDFEHGEAPPDYTSPVADRGEGIPRLPSVRVDSSLPAIQVIGSTPAATPVMGSGHISQR